MPRDPVNRPGHSGHRVIPANPAVVAAAEQQQQNLQRRARQQQQ